MDEDQLAQHREQAARRPRCCRRLANQYREIAETYRQHKERFGEAEQTSLSIANIYEAAALDAGTWEDDCEDW